MKFPDEDVRLPWWPTFRMRTGAGISSRAMNGSTDTSASPINKSETSPYRTSSTTESALRTRRRSHSGARGLSTAYLRPAQLQRILCLEPAPRAVSIAGSLAQRGQERMTANRHALPYLARMEKPEDAGGAAGVIRVAMCHEQIVETTKPSMPRWRAPRRARRRRTMNRLRALRHRRADCVRQAGPAVWHRPGRHRSTAPAGVRDVLRRTTAQHESRAPPRSRRCRLRSSSGAHGGRCSAARAIGSPALLRQQRNTSPGRAAEAVERARPPMAPRARVWLTRPAALPPSTARRQSGAPHPSTRVPSQRPPFRRSARQP